MASEAPKLEERFNDYACLLRVMIETVLAHGMTFATESAKSHKDQVRNLVEDY